MDNVKEMLVVKKPDVPQGLKRAFLVSSQCFSFTLHIIHLAPSKEEAHLVASYERRSGYFPTLVVETKNGATSLTPHHITAGYVKK